MRRTSSGLSVTQMNKTYLRPGGTNTAIGAINVTGNTLTNVSSPVNDHDAANKNYVDENENCTQRTIFK